MKRSGYVPDRGDAVWVTSMPDDGIGSSERRQAVVLSYSAYNGKVGMALTCPIISEVKGYPFEVRIPPRMDVSGAILSDQVKSLDWRALKAEFICRLPEATVSQVLRKTSALLEK